MAEDAGVRVGGGAGQGHLEDIDREQLGHTVDPTPITCRTGPRSSAVIYLYAGLQAGATADEVLACAEADGALFAGSDELKAWVAQGLDELS